MLLRTSFSRQRLWARPARYRAGLVVVGAHAGRPVQREDGYVPVSYTHLDVYKRQGMGVPASAHFKLSEFKCKDGTAVPAKYYGHCQKLMNLLEEIREACGDCRKSPMKSIS